MQAKLQQHNAGRAAAASINGTSESKGMCYTLFSKVQQASNLFIFSSLSAARQLSRLMTDTGYQMHTGPPHGSTSAANSYQPVAPGQLAGTARGTADDRTQEPCCACTAAHESWWLKVASAMTAHTAYVALPGMVLDALCG